MKISHAYLAFGLLSSASLAAACVGDPPEGEGALDAGSTSSSSSSSSSGVLFTSSGAPSSSSSSGTVEPTDGAASSSSSGETPPDPRCTGPIDIHGAGVQAIACTVPFSLNPPVELVIGAFDLTRVDGHANTASCPLQEAWKGSLEIVPDGINYTMHLALQVAGARSDYDFSARVKNNSTLIVETLCGSDLPFASPVDAGSGASEVSFRLDQTDGGPRFVDFQVNGLGSFGISHVHFTAR